MLVAFVALGCNHDERCRKAAAGIPSKRLLTAFESLCIKQDWSSAAMDCLSHHPFELMECLKRELSEDDYARAKTVL